MSTKTKNDVDKTALRKAQSKTKRTTYDAKLESSRSAKETVKEKPKNDTKKIQPQTPKGNTAPRISDRQIVKGNAKIGQPVQKPLKARPAAVSNDRVATPPSKRVTKTQFFPSKNNYAEVLHHLDKYASGDASPRRASSNLDKRQVERNLKKIPGTQKQLIREESTSESNSVSERPRTSTLRKGSIVNQNIAGPEVPKEAVPDISRYKQKSVVQEEIEGTEADSVEYEDDFESYESDFENCSSSDSTIHNISEISTEGSSSSTSSEDNLDEASPLSADKEVEKKLDSGNFDLNETKKKQEFINIQQMIEKDNSNNTTPDSHVKSNLTSLSDEGFEESKSLQFLNFAGAKKKYERRKSLEMRRKRGEELSNMIKLDYVSFTIFDVPPVPYEEFIKSFGNVNSMQVGVQTGEENVDDEVQTEEIRTSAKWTQIPIHISKTDSNFYKFERIGVGPDPEEILKGDEEHVEPSINESRLERFLTSSGELILNLLKEQQPLSGRIKSGSSENSFSEGVVQFKPPSEFLGKRKISYVSFSPSNPSVFLSVHVNDFNEDNSRSMVYIWNVNDVFPELYLVCYGKITSCCFGSDSSTVFAGLENGILVVWEMKENLSLIKNMYPMVEGDVVLRSPIFITEIETSHCSPVVSIQTIVESETGDIFNSEAEHAKQVCSLDSEGDIIIWGVIAKHQIDIGQNKGLAHWGRIFLCKNLRISLRNVVSDMGDLLCTDMVISNLESKSAFVATNYGSIIRCTLDKDRTNVKIHSSEDSSSANCFSMCPFSSMYFLAGFENGNINLYSGRNSKPLVIISNKECGNGNESISDIQWSTEKPCIFYTKNAKNTLDIWDLSRSNIFPIESVSFKETVTCMKISPTSEGKHGKVFMIISTETTIYMHLLSSDYRKRSLEEYQEEMNTFMNYVSRL